MQVRTPPQSAPAPAADPMEHDTVPLNAEIEAAYAQVPFVPPVGGDFHAAFPLEDGSVAFILGDVAGHGPESAAHAQQLSRAIAGCLLEGLSPDEALAFVNAAAEMSPEFDGFATVVAGTVAPHTGEIVYASGGHEPPLVAAPCPPELLHNKREREKCVVELDSTGPPLGVVSGHEAHYDRRTATLPNDGTLLLYTDGVTEARRGKNFMGTDRLRGLLARVSSLPPLSLVRKIIGYARAFSGQGRKLRDDAALLALRRHK